MDDDGVEMEGEWGVGRGSTGKDTSGISTPEVPMGFGTITAS